MTGLSSHKFFFEYFGQDRPTLEEVIDIGCWTSLLEVRRLLRFKRNSEFIQGQPGNGFDDHVAGCEEELMAMRGQDQLSVYFSPKGKGGIMVSASLVLTEPLLASKTSPGGIGKCWYAAWGSGSLWVWQGKWIMILGGRNAFSERYTLRVASYSSSLMLLATLFARTTSFWCLMWTKELVDNISARWMVLWWRHHVYPSPFPIYRRLLCPPATIPPARFMAKKYDQLVDKEYVGRVLSQIPLWAESYWAVIANNMHMSIVTTLWMASGEMSLILTEAIAHVRSSHSCVDRQECQPCVGM